jgi:hypothetical protein
MFTQSITKSKIQLIKEHTEYCASYSDHLKELMDKYNVVDGIFVYTGDKLYESTKGYFEVVAKGDNLNEVLNHWNNEYLMGVRIVNNKDFAIGYIKERLSECSQESNVIDINNLKEIR